MKRKIKISVDSTCDLPQEIMEKYDISYYPFYINIGEDQYKDNGVDITPSQLFDRYKKDNILPKTAAINVGDFINYFSKLKENYDYIIHINLSNGISSANDNAILASKEFENVYIVNSCSLSSASGMLAIKAAEMIDSNIDVLKIVETLNNIKNKLSCTFVLDTLDYMAAGGRCPSLAAKAAGMLKCKPSIYCDTSDGKLHMGKIYRGKIEKVLQKYIKDKLEDGKVDTQYAFITCSAGFEDNYIGSLVEYAKEIIPFEKIYTSTASCTISSHCGPKCLGILFFNK